MHENVRLFGITVNFSLLSYRAKQEIGCKMWYITGYVKKRDLRQQQEYKTKGRFIIHMEFPQKGEGGGGGVQKLDFITVLIKFC